MRFSIESLARPQAFAAHAFALWKGQDKLQKDLAEALALQPETLSRWLSGHGQPGLESAARVIFHLYLAKCFDDPTEALDLAWLMGMTATDIEDHLTKAFHVDLGLARFLNWLQNTPDPRIDAEGTHYLPSLPTYHVPTELARQVEEALVTPRAYRVPLRQVAVLHGGPGVGKTTTAAAILRDEQVHHFFRDGVFFIPLGSGADREQALWRACQQAGLEIDRDTLEDELQALFRQWAGDESRLALVVLDDPPEACCLIPLLHVGPQVRLLITCQNRHAVAHALTHRWEPNSDLILWQQVSGLSEDEGLALVKHWPPQELSPDEERARQHVGERIRWHPVLLSLCAAEVGDTGWQHVEALLVEGSLDPDDLAVLNTWVQKSWERLSGEDQRALVALQRASRHTSTFGVGFGTAVWNQSPAQTQMRLNRLAARALIEPVTEEPWPWQEAIAQAYGGQERYRLIPPLAILPLEGDSTHGMTVPDDTKALQAISRRARALPIGPRQIPLRFQIANLLALPAAWLFRRDTNRLEDRLVDLWTRQGLPPPAEVWLTFQKSRWSYLPFGYVLGVLLLLIGGWYLGTAFREGDSLWALVTLLAWVSALSTVYLFIRQRAWWLWLLDLHGQETTELAWTWHVARLFGLRRPSDRMEMLSWKTDPPSLQ